MRLQELRLDDDQFHDDNYNNNRNSNDNNTVFLHCIVLNTKTMDSTSRHSPQQSEQILVALGLKLGIRPYKLLFHWSPWRPTAWLFSSWLVTPGSSGHHLQLLPPPPPSPTPALPPSHSPTFPPSSFSFSFALPLSSSFFSSYSL